MDYSLEAYLGRQTVETLKRMLAELSEREQTEHTRYLLELVNSVLDARQADEAL